MARVTAALALAIVAASGRTARADPVDRPMPSGWTFAFGAGALALPSYPGAASIKLLPLPFVDVRYRDWVFFSPMTGLGVNLVAMPEARLGVSLLPDLGRTASQGDRLRGWGDISAGADVKLFGELRFAGPVAVLAAVRRQLAGGNGTLVDAGLTGTLPLMRRLIVSATATVSWADARYTRAYFGIDADQSAAALLYGSTIPAYAAGAGLRDATLALLAIVPIDRHWYVQSVARAEVLLGDAASSPLTERRLQPAFGGFLAYRL